jgi:hypothetical protein
MATNTSTGLLKYLGMIGNSGLHTGSLVPRANTPDAQQRLYQDFQDSGKVADPDIWTKFNTYMRRPTTFDSMLQMWEEMSMWDLIAAALVGDCRRSHTGGLEFPGLGVVPVQRPGF